jgi:hypothetical protein
MPESLFNAGPVPVVQPGDIRNAVAVLQPIRRSGKKGIFGDPRLRDGCAPGSDLPSVAKLREADPLPDAVFQIVATYPITCGEDNTFDFDMPGFIAALEASG